MQVVPTGITDMGVDALNAGFRLEPVIAEFGLAAHRLLRFAQGGFVSLEAVERVFEAAVRQGEKAFDPHVETNGCALMNGHLNLSLGLDCHIPLAV